MEWGVSVELHGKGERLGQAQSLGDGGPQAGFRGRALV